MALTTFRCQSSRAPLPPLLPLSLAAGSAHADPVQLLVRVVGPHLLERVRQSTPLVLARLGQSLSDIVHPDPAAVVAHRDVKPRRRPGDPVERRRAAVHHGARRRHLRLRVEVPDVQPAGAVDGGEQGRVQRRPGGVIYVVRVVLERVQRLSLLSDRTAGARDSKKWEGGELPQRETARVRVKMLV